MPLTHEPVAHILYWGIWYVFNCFALTFKTVPPGTGNEVNKASTRTWYGDLVIRLLISGINIAIVITTIISVAKLDPVVAPYDTDAKRRIIRAKFLTAVLAVSTIFTHLFSFFALLGSDNAPERIKSMCGGRPRKSLRTAATFFMAVYVLFEFIIKLLVHARVDAFGIKARNFHDVANIFAAINIVFVFFVTIASVCTSSLPVMKENGEVEYKGHGFYLFETDNKAEEGLQDVGLYGTLAGYCVNVRSNWFPMLASLLGWQLFWNELFNDLGRNWFAHIIHIGLVRYMVGWTGTYDTYMFHSMTATMVMVQAYLFFPMAFFQEGWTPTATPPPFWEHLMLLQSGNNSVMRFDEEQFFRNRMLVSSIGLAITGTTVFTIFKWCGYTSRGRVEKKKKNKSKRDRSESSNSSVPFGG